jgi:hypothetical protein
VINQKPLFELTSFLSLWTLEGASLCEKEPLTQNALLRVLDGADDIGNSSTFMSA